MPSLISLRARTDALATRNKTRHSTRRGGHFPRALRASRFPWMSIARQERLLWTTLGLAFGAASYVNLRVRPRGALSGRTRAAKTTRFDASLRSFPRPPPPPTRPSVASSSLRLLTASPVPSSRSALFGAPRPRSRTSSPPRRRRSRLFRCAGRSLSLDRRNQRRGLVFPRRAQVSLQTAASDLTSAPPRPPTRPRADSLAQADEPVFGATAKNGIRRAWNAGVDRVFGDLVKFLKDRQL